MKKYFMLVFLFCIEVANVEAEPFWKKKPAEIIKPPDIPKIEAPKITIPTPPKITNKGIKEIQGGGQYYGNQVNQVGKDFQGGAKYYGNQINQVGKDFQGGAKYYGNQINQVGKDFQGGAKYYGNQIKQVGKDFQGDAKYYGNQINQVGKDFQGGAKYYGNQSSERTKATINYIDNSVMRNVDTINQGAEYEYNRAAARSQELGQQLQDYRRENPVDNEGLESAFEAAAAAKKNLGKSTKQFGTQVKKTIKDVGSSEPAKSLNNLGTRVSMENIKHGVSNTVEYLNDSEAGSSLDEVGRNVSIGSIKKGITNTGDYWNSTEPINAVGGLAAKVKPTMEKIGEGIENIDKAREKALEDLRQFDPEEIFGWVQQSIKEDIDEELKRNGLAFNQETGELDLRNSRMGKTLLNWLEKFTQGNNAEEEIAVFTYNVNSRKLEVGLYARHRQSWKGGVDLYSVTQRAGFWYDFQSSSGDFEIDPGQLSPRFNSKTLKKLSEGDLVGIAETSSPTAVRKAMHYERVNEYEKNLNELRTRYGAENVYLASQGFVDWATPETLAKYAVNGVLTAGASVYPKIMADARKRAASEMPSITKWLVERGMDNATAVAMELLTGNPPKWPFLKFEMIPVRYSAREKPLNAITTEWRHVNHLAFVITWVNGGSNESRRNDEILDRVRNPQISSEKRQFGL